MARVAVIGAGAGGAAAAADLSLRGHAVTLFSRSAATLEPFRAAGGVRHSGVIGDGLAPVRMVAGDLAQALSDAEVAIVCLPAPALAALAGELGAIGCELPLVLNPGHTAAALHLRALMADATPPLAALSTLTYVARCPEPGAVHITATAARVRGARLPGGDAALDWACALYPAVRREPDVLAAGLANVNFVLHPPAAVLGAAWVESTDGAFRFYADATTPAVVRVIQALDGERLAVARAFDHELDPLLHEMAAIGTVDPAPAAAADLGAAIAGAAANRAIRAPGSLRHRYYTEDLGHGLLPFRALADVAGVPVPTTAALLDLADTFLPDGVYATGLDGDRLGITGLHADGLLTRVREAVAA